MPKVPPKKLSTTKPLASSAPLSADSEIYEVGDKVYLPGLKKWGTVRFFGTTIFSEGKWVGVELQTDAGRNDGTVAGHQYFKCKPNYGLFVRPSNCSRRISVQLDQSKGKTLEKPITDGSQPNDGVDVNKKNTPYVDHHGRVDDEEEREGQHTPKLRVHRSSSITKTIGTKSPSALKPRTTAIRSLKTRQPSPTNTDDNATSTPETNFDGLLSRLHRGLSKNIEEDTPDRAITRSDSNIDSSTIFDRLVR